MNFAQIREIIDQKDEKGWPKTLAMFGVITEFKGEGINQQTQKPYKKVVIRDDNGELHNVTLRGTLPDASIVLQKAGFSLSSYNGTYQDGTASKSYIGYSGFWNSKAQIAPQGAQTPPQGQNAAPQAAQTPPATSGVAAKADAKTVFVTMIIAAASSQDVPLDQVITIAKRWVEEVYAYEKPNAPSVGADTDDDIPW